MTRSKKSMAGGIELGLEALLKDTKQYEEAIGTDKEQLYLCNMRAGMHIASAMIETLTNVYLSNGVDERRNKKLAGETVGERLQRSYFDGKKISELTALEFSEIIEFVRVETKRRTGDEQ